MTNSVVLRPASYYHIYNRGNNRENLFREERNYAYFLQLYAYHVAPAAETYAYCLMRNHFHLLVRIRDGGCEDVQGRASQCFSNFFNAYTKAFNRAYHRSGALFERPFNRIEVSTEAYLYRLVTYIHQNSQHHGFVVDFRDWPHSSYHPLLSDRPTRLNRADVLEWFGSRENLQSVHEEPIPELLINAFAPGDSTWGHQT